MSKKIKIEMWKFSVAKGNAPSPPAMSSIAPPSQSEDENGVKLLQWTHGHLAHAPVFRFQAPGIESWWEAEFHLPLGKL